jgi:hypothetical protein
MAYNPNDPDRITLADDPYRTTLRTNDELQRAARLDNELQVDPELAEGPASSGKIAMFALGIAVILGAVFYGLNNTSINQAGTSPTAQNVQTSPPAAPPGMRDVTPRASNTDAGVTTGAAPAARPAPPANSTPPSNAPSGSEK